MNAWSIRSVRRSAIVALAAIVVTAFVTGTEAAAPPPPISATVTFLYYDDIEAQIPFYEGLLQLTPTLVEDWVRIYRITETSSVGLVLNGRGFHVVSADKPAMLSLVTDEIDAWYARLVEAGAKVLVELPPPSAPAKPGGAPTRNFIVEDPGGYTIEFFAWRKSP